MGFLFVSPNGQADIVVSGPDYSLVHYWAPPGVQTIPGWSHEIVAGKNTAGSWPSIFVDANGVAHVVTSYGGGPLMYYWGTPGSQWSSFKVAASAVFPSIFVRANGEVDIVAWGPDNQITYYWATPGSQWNSTQVAANAGFPSIFVRANGEADIVAVGQDNSLMYYWATPGSQWNSTQVAGPGTPQPGQPPGPGIFVRDDGEANIVVNGPNQSLVFYWAIPGSKWFRYQLAPPGTTYSTPCIFVRSANPAYEADVVAQGPNNSLMYYWTKPRGGRKRYTLVSVPPEWGVFQVAGPQTTFSDYGAGQGPCIFVRDDGEADIVAVGPDLSLMYYWATPGSPWGSVQVAGPNTVAP